MLLEKLHVQVFGSAAVAAARATPGGGGDDDDDDDDDDGPAAASPALAVADASMGAAAAAGHPNTHADDYNLHICTRKFKRRRINDASLSGRTCVIYIFVNLLIIVQCPFSGKRKHADIIEEIIAKSKQAKYQRKVEKDETEEKTEKLDDEWKSLAGLLGGIRPVRKDEVRWRSGHQLRTRTKYKLFFYLYHYFNNRGEDGFLIY